MIRVTARRRYGPLVVPPPSAWPDISNTGFANAPGYPGNLSVPPGSLVAGQTYSFRDFGSGLAVDQPDTTFIGCRFQSNDVLDANVIIGADKVTFDYCTFEPSATSSPPPSPTATDSSTASTNAARSNSP